MLVTGPDGLGQVDHPLRGASRSSTQPDRTLITIEDPVEYEIDGVKQIQVNPKTGLTFAKGLRSMMRADPDVVLVGEIRDRETAQIAIEAALTGHLVLSTLHTNDAPTSIVRLIEMGIEPFLVASGVDCVIAQRLVRTLCDECKERDQAQRRDAARERLRRRRGHRRLRARRLRALRPDRLPRPDRALRGHADLEDDARAGAGEPSPPTRSPRWPRRRA